MDAAKATRSWSGCVDADMSDGECVVCCQGEGGAITGWCVGDCVCVCACACACVCRACGVWVVG